MLSREQLQRAAAGSGFQVESCEKVYVLVRLLEAVRTHPFLAARMALKGGTALNLFVLDFPRLSVDIDLNYIGSPDRATMLAERPRIEQALQQVTGCMGLTLKRAPTEHAGGKWRLSYATALGRRAASRSTSPAMQALLRDHPGLKWKALNVKKRLGAEGDI
jgi:predicted nucleotidyltransferase component of viral defense system